MVISPENIAIAILLAVTIILTAWIIRIELKLGKVLRGKNAKTLEDTIVNLSREIKTLEEFKGDSEKYWINVERRLRRSVQGVGVVRFNAFQGEGLGGNQSFATALLDENGNGTVFSSIYSRDRVSVFSKPVKNYSSEYELSKEEKEAINKSKESLAIR